MRGERGDQGREGRRDEGRGGGEEGREGEREEVAPFLLRCPVTRGCCCVAYRPDAGVMQQIALLLGSVTHAALCDVAEQMTSVMACST